MIIKNKNELAISKLRAQALELIEVGINRVMPENLIDSFVKYDSASDLLAVSDKTFNLSAGRLFVIGGGKAAGLMAEKLENIMGPNRITAGIVNCKDNNYQVKSIKITKASHPIPNKKSIKGVKKMLALRNQYSINEKDFIVCLISGGGSALMSYPVDRVSLTDKQRITELLIRSGAEIQEANYVKKHLSKIKGGQLGKFFAPATVISLIISDVVSNDIESIASGPTVPDSSTYQDAYEVLEKYDLLSKAPKSVVKFLDESIKNNLVDTPEKLDNCYNYIIGNNLLAIGAMADKAHHFGLKPLVVTAQQTGDPTVVAKARAQEIINGKYIDYDTIIIGGETTPCLPKNAGEGGRNQHFAAASLLEMKNYQGEFVVAGVSTDGIDYSEVAGAIIDNNTLTLAKDKGLDINKYLEKYDSGRLFKRIGKSLIITGDTGTNVSDVMIYLVK